MENETDNQFIWVIKNFSSLKSEKIYSDEFVIGGCRWRLIAYPEGDKTALIANDNSMSLYLDVVDSESLPSGWRRRARLSFTIVNLKKLSHRKETVHGFNVKQRDWGFTNMLPLGELKAKDGGFLANDELIIVVGIELLKVIGKSDVSESMDVNGFHVLPSQVKSVKRLFEKHPCVAKNLRVENQHMKTGYLNVLLSLSTTLRQPPNKISAANLADAYTALESLTDVGFELDWLKKKLDQLSEKKDKEKAGETRMQEIQEELKDLKKKCSDLEAQLEKEKAEVLEAGTLLSSPDDF